MNSLNEYTKNLRHDFQKADFSEKDAHANPFKQFEKWFDEAVKSALHEPNAMVLSTSTKKGRPSSRIVLLRGLKGHGFNFFTNYDSRKGKELKENPCASLLFYWPDLERQVRIEGKVEVAPAHVSDEYFSSRPRISRLGAWASPQSRILPNRKELDVLVSRYGEMFRGEVPRPGNWGGYILKASYYEFWQGRQSRLHDRICYTLKNGRWKKERLAP
jgi:pyridoxamine 5'-phosphate oxidase